MFYYQTGFRDGAAFVSPGTRKSEAAWHILEAMVKKYDLTPENYDGDYQEFYERAFLHIRYTVLDGRLVKKEDHYSFHSEYISFVNYPLSTLTELEE